LLDQSISTDDSIIKKKVKKKKKKNHIPFAELHSLLFKLSTNPCKIGQSNKYTKAKVSKVLVVL